MQDSAQTPGPPGAMSCAFCHRLIDKTYYQLGLRTVCPSCAAQVQMLAAKNAFDPQAWTRGAVVGLAAALGGGLVWALVARFTHYELGILAVGIGWIVCVAVR